MRLSRAATFAVLLGLYWTFNGYESRDGDQAYRLPLLIDRQEPGTYATDPFVRAFDAFNPHLGYLTLLDLTSRVMGLSAALAFWSIVTFALTALGIDRLARAIWSDRTAEVGPLAMGLFLLAQAGNIGTNHLYEPMLLDRLLAWSLGWIALAELIANPERAWRLSPPLILAASWIHPSVGIQLGGWLIASWGAFAIASNGSLVARRAALLGIVGTLAALLPRLALIPEQSRVLRAGLDPRSLLDLAAFVQSPQHLVPHLWRSTQWAAWFAYLLAGLLSWKLAKAEAASASTAPTAEAARSRFAIVVVLGLAGLLNCYIIIEGWMPPSLTLFQPFRMATPIRGLMLVLLSGYIQALLLRGDRLGFVRAVLLMAGMMADGSWIVATAAEVAFALAPRPIAGWACLGLGIAWLFRDDPEASYRWLAAAAPLAFLAYPAWERLKGLDPSRALPKALILAWSGPALAIAMLALAPSALDPATDSLAKRWRFGERPISEVERLAAWSRDHLPRSARFVTPPGPKEFRLWSHRSVVFNRASSPYHAAGLADWADRFRDHVGFSGDFSDFARAYIRNRQELERGFDRKDAEALAALARRQEAGYILASSKLEAGPALVKIRAEGRYAIYRLASE